MAKKRSKSTLKREAEQAAAQVPSADVAAMEKKVSELRGTILTQNRLIENYRKTFEGHDAANKKAIASGLAEARAENNQLQNRLEAAEADAAEAVKTSHEIADRLRKEFMEERTRVQGWQKTAGELQEENTRLKSQQDEHKALLAERCREAQLLTAERDDAVQAVFSWRLACFLLVSLCATLSAIMIFAW